MPLKLPNLDDRRFDDLVSELQERLRRQLPDLSVMAPGDPAHAMVDLFAWLTETVLYRANLIPERQRLAFLNLLQIPLRAATAAGGIVSVDAGSKTAILPALLPSESTFRAGKQIFSSTGEVQPTPLIMHTMVKEKLSLDDLNKIGLTPADLAQLYGEPVLAFRPRALVPGAEILDLSVTIDQSFYLGFSIPAKLVEKKDELRDRLAGLVLNIGVAPDDATAAEQAREVGPRSLRWDLAREVVAADGLERDLHYMPLELLDDSSLGGRQAGVARLRLPQNPELLQPPEEVDPQYAGVGAYPPAAPDAVTHAQQMFWIRLQAPDEPALRLGYLGVNCVEVLGQAVLRNRFLGVASGDPDLQFALSAQDVDAASLRLEVEESGVMIPWGRVAHLAESGPNDRSYRLEAAEGRVIFGDGQRGRVPPRGAGVRATYCRHGGGSGGNLPAGSIKSLEDASPELKVRQDWPTQGGVDAETPATAERRIPAYLAHRDRAVTEADFESLARHNPINPVARAEAVPGLLPGDTIESLRRDVPGVVSVFVLPPLGARLGAAPRPSRGLLKDVCSYLRRRTLVGTELFVLSPQFIPVAISVNLRVLDPRREQQTVQAVQAALVDFLWALPPGGPRATGWPLAYTVDAAEIRTRLARVDGILAIPAVALHVQADDGQWRTATDARLELRDFQLPELMAVSAAISDEPTAPLPDGLLPTADGPASRPVPVIPDVCGRQGS